MDHGEDVRISDFDDDPPSDDCRAFALLERAATAATHHLLSVDEKERYRAALAALDVVLPGRMADFLEVAFDAVSPRAAG